MGRPCQGGQGPLGPSVRSYTFAVVTITLRALNDDDLNVLFRWGESSRGGQDGGLHPSRSHDRVAFDAHYQRVLSNPENWTRAIDEDGVLVGMIASFTIEGERELTYWVDPSRWGQGIATGAV